MDLRAELQTRRLTEVVKKVEFNFKIFKLLILKLTYQSRESIKGDLGGQIVWIRHGTVNALDNVPRNSVYGLDKISHPFENSIHPRFLGLDSIMLGMFV